MKVLVVATHISCTMFTCNIIIMINEAVYSCRVRILLLRLTARDWVWTILKLMLYLLHFYSDVNQIYVCEAKHHNTYRSIFIFIFCYLQPVQILGQLWCDREIFDKVGQHHSPDFVVPSEALGTIQFTLYVQELDK